MKRTYLEIGTCDFETLNERFKDRPSWSGLSAEALPHYFDKLPKLSKNQYVQAIVTPEQRTEMQFYYVPEAVIKAKGLPDWLKGCSSTDANRPALLQYAADLASITLPTISLAALVDRLEPHLDLVRIDTEGTDCALVRKLLTLPVTVTHVIFEITHAPALELQETYSALFRHGYEYRGIKGGDVQFSKPSVMMVCDPVWSTGSIVRDLQHLSERWLITMLDWRNYPPDMDLVLQEHDTAVGMTLFTAKAWPAVSHCVVSCGPGEPRWLGDGYKGSPVMGGVSAEVCAKLSMAYPGAKVFHTPATARLGRFFHPDVQRPLQTLGWCGNPAYRFCGDDCKRYAMFEEILEKSKLEAVVSGQNYRYDNMEEFYDSVDLLISTSTEEGGPLGVFEAIAAGVPVISTNTGVIKEFPGIWTFSTVPQALQLIEELRPLGRRRSYAELQYDRLKQGRHMQALLPRWEALFEAGATHKASFL